MCIEWEGWPACVVPNGKFPVNSQYRQWAPVPPIDSTSARSANDMSTCQNMPRRLHCHSLFPGHSTHVPIHNCLCQPDPTRAPGNNQPGTGNNIKNTILSNGFSILQNQIIQDYSENDQYFNTLFYQLMGHSDTYIHFLYANIFPTWKRAHMAT